MRSPGGLSFPNGQESRVQRYVALLRAVNVGGTKRVGMAELRGVLDEIGFREPRTLLQSGNLVFGAPLKTAAEVERRLEGEFAARLGLSTDVLVRTAGDLDAAIASNPFPDEAERDPAHLVVMFLRDSPNATSVEVLQASIAGPERVRAAGCQSYVTYPAGIGDSRLTNAVLERALGTRGTARNWNTVTKLAAAVRDR